jgi:copper chaperone CopZ
VKKFFVVFFMAAFFMAAHGQNAQNPNLLTSYYKSNMHCASCEKTLFEYLRFEKGVKDLKVDHASNTVKVVYDKRKNSEEKLAKSIGKKGYDAEKITAEEYAKLNDGAAVRPAQGEHQH